MVHVYRGEVVSMLAFTNEVDDTRSAAATFGGRSVAPSSNELVAVVLRDIVRGRNNFFAARCDCLAWDCVPGGGFSYLTAVRILCLRNT